MKRLLWWLIVGLICVLCSIGIIWGERKASGSQDRYVRVWIDGVNVMEAVEKNTQVLKLRGQTLIELNRYVGELNERLKVYERWLQQVTPWIWFEEPSIHYLHKQLVLGCPPEICPPDPRAIYWYPRVGGAISGKGVR